MSLSKWIVGFLYFRGTQISKPSQVMNPETLTGVKDYNDRSVPDMFLLDLSCNFCDQQSSEFLLGCRYFLPGNLSFAAHCISTLDASLHSVSKKMTGSIFPIFIRVAESTVIGSTCIYTL